MFNIVVKNQYLTSCTGVINHFQCLLLVSLTVEVVLALKSLKILLSPLDFSLSCLILEDDTDQYYLLIIFFLEGTLTSFFEDKKSYYFWLMIDGSRRLKNMRIRRIRNRMRMRHVHLMCLSNAHQACGRLFSKFIGQNSQKIQRGRTQFI